MEEAVRKIVLEHLKNIKDGISQKMVAQGRNATGKTVASLEIVEEGSHGIILGNKSFLYLERGRGPGKVPANFHSIIREWILAKGIDYRNLVPANGTSEQGLRRLTGMIAHSIMTKGTSLYRNKGYNDIFDTLIEKEVKKLTDETVSEVEMQIERINQANAGDVSDNKQ